MTPEMRDHLCSFMEAVTRCTQVQVDAAMKMAYPDLPAEQYPKVMYIVPGESDRVEVQGFLDKLMGDWFPVHQRPAS